MTLTLVQAVANNATSSGGGGGSDDTVLLTAIRDLLGGWDTGGLPTGANVLGTVGLNSGSNLVGKFGIDQTTPGTTNLVAAGQSGTWNLNNISGTISLPTGAATAAKQPALGTAGTASADVLTIQGIASMVALKTDASATTQPISGSVTLLAGSALIGKFGIDQTTPGTTNKVSIGTDGTVVLGAGTAEIGNVKNSGTFAVQSTLQAGSALVGKFGIDQTTPGTTNLVAAGQNGTWNITNISGTVTLPTGASTAAKQPALGTAGTASADVLTVQGIASMTAIKTDSSAVTQPISGSVTLLAGSALVGKFGIDQTTPGTTNLVAAGQNGTWNLNNISGTISLPTGAATAAKQPALGTAGTASADVLTVQGITSMTALKTDGSAVTQPVSGTVALSAGSALIGKVGIDQTTPGTTNLVAAGQNGTWTVQPGNTANTTPWLFQGNLTSNNAAPAASANLAAMGAIATAAAPSLTEGNLTFASQDLSGNRRVRLPGCTPYVLSSLKTVVTAVSSAAGQLCIDDLFTVDSVPVYLQGFDVASGTAVTLGTTVPNIVLGLPCNATAANGIATRGERAKGYNFVNGLKLAATTTPTGSTTSTNGINGTIGTAAA